MTHPMLPGASIRDAEQLDLIAFLAGETGGDTAGRSAPIMGLTGAAMARVQNEHTRSASVIEHPGADSEANTVSVAMSPRRLLVCLAVLGWPERELARRMGRHQTEVRRWVSGASPVRADVAVWLETLTAFHEAHPAPRSERRRSKRRRPERR